MSRQSERGRGGSGRPAPARYLRRDELLTLADLFMGSRTLSIQELVRAGIPGDAFRGFIEGLVQTGQEVRTVEGPAPEADKLAISAEQAFWTGFWAGQYVAEGTDYLQDAEAIRAESWDRAIGRRP
jgi:hypothetical protein